MKFIIKPQQTGKTTELIKMSAATGAVIVALNPIRVNHIRRLALKWAIKIPDPIPLSRIINNEYCRESTKAFLFDDVEEILQAVFRWIPILAVTGTQSPGEPGIVKEDNIEFKSLPPWLQKLWELSPELAREAEAEIGQAFQTSDDEIQRAVFYDVRLGKPIENEEKENNQ